MTVRFEFAHFWFDSHGNVDEQMEALNAWGRDGWQVVASTDFNGTLNGFLLQREATESKS